LDGSADAVFDLDRFWATVFFVPGDGWKALGDLTGADHELIADKYELGAIALRARADFHRSVASKVGNSTTKEAFNPRTLMRQIDAAYNTAALTGGN
jgi:hypothetical protein